MITKAILALVLAPFRAALALLPEIAPPDLTGLVTAMDPIWQAGGYVNNYLPLSEAATLFGMLLVAFQVVMVVRATLWILTKAHILGGE